MILLATLPLTLPIDNPVMKFLIILLIILLAPLILNKLKIPHILGLIIAGAIVGPHGFNLILRDSSIILSGTAGLLYIMFLAGLEIDLTEFKKNSSKSILFGIYTFTIPMTIGLLTGLYVLEFSLMTSVLLASMFASHTLIAYPIINKMGVNRNRAVTATIGGTMITDTLALLVLAVIVGMTQGVVDAYFWTKLTISIILFGITILFGFPIIARLFFKHYSDSVSQYIFVLAMVFLGAALAELAGIEAIIGAFLSGLALNRLIPRSSPLMNRVEFIGNAIFIPFFLIGVGMLVDYRVFFSDFNTIRVALIMTVVATVSKYLAAYFTQKTFKYTSAERIVIFGLSNAQAAATLAAVLVGYNVILGQTPDGEPIRLLNESVLNGTIVMIFITCTIASIYAQRGAYKLATSENSGVVKDVDDEKENILISLRNPKYVEELINLAGAIKCKSNANTIMAVNVIDSEADDEVQVKKSQKLLDQAKHVASASDLYLNTCLRYDVNFINGIIGVMREQRTTDLILGVDKDRFLTQSPFGNVLQGVINQSNVTTFIYRSEQPLATIKRQILIIPPFAENEIGFPFWIYKIWNIVKSTGCKLVVYGNESTLAIFKKINDLYPIDMTLSSLPIYDDLLIITKDLRSDDAIIFVLGKKNSPSYNPCMEKIPSYIDSYFKQTSFILIYPLDNCKEDDISDLTNPSALGSFNKIEKLSNSISKLLSKIN